MQDLIFIVGFLIVMLILAIAGSWYAHIFWHAIMIGWGS